MIVASELLTNAIRYGGERATLCLRSDGNGCVLDVTDGAPAVTPKVVRGRPVAEGGVGLVLALALSSEVGWYVTARQKHVWARFLPHAM